MTNAGCIWGLLSRKELEFIHVSSFNKLKGHSLFQFIHPDEVLLAERDLFKFISSNKFGGSITRCRMKNYYNNNNSSWVIVDIIMYIATKNLVLCFLHQYQDSQHCKIMDETSINQLRDCLHKEEANEDDYQFFRIVDNQTRSVVLTWPDHYGDTLLLLDDRSMSPKNSCFHCVQPSSRLNTFRQRIDTLFIDYGLYTFILDTIHIPSSTTFIVPLKRKKQTTPHPYTLHEKTILLSTNNKHQLKPQINRVHCQSCGTDSSPEWRRGPTGHKT